MNEKELEQIREVIREELSNFLQKKKVVKKQVQTISGMLDIWKIHFEDDFFHSPAEAAALLNLQKKLIFSLKAAERPFDDETVKETFKALLQHLPTWYRDKGLMILNSKYNDIIKQIRKDKSAITENDLVYFHNHFNSN